MSLFIKHNRLLTIQNTGEGPPVPKFTEQLSASPGGRQGLSGY